MRSGLPGVLFSRYPDSRPGLIETSLRIPDPPAGAA
jgi:hypothetical protein